MQAEAIFERDVGDTLGEFIRRMRGGWSIARVLDLVLASALLIMFAPLMLCIATAIWIIDGGPALFCQTRIGFGGRRFRCLKFRSMVVDAERRLDELLRQDLSAQEEWRLAHKLRRDPRITLFGLFLRRSSLDELPQLFNVLLGDMSLVGPRPICAEEAHLYRRYYTHYCSIRPGLTGLWQVSGRNDLSYRRRVALDVAYIRRQDVGVYLRILLATIPAVIMQKGAA